MAAVALALMVVVAVAWIIMSRRTVPLATTQLVERATSAPAAIAPGGAAATREFAWPADAPFSKPSATDASAAAPAGGGAVMPSRAIEDIVAASMPAVVLIESPGGKGTGFFVAPDRVVTNAHVVPQAGYVTVVTAGGTRLSARVTTVSQGQDLAIVAVPDAKQGQAVLPLGSLDDVRVGQEVLAIGAPLGFQNTVTRGIVSAVRRAGDVALVQTDAAINPGNSGGPLLDRAGRVIAVTTMKIAGSAESLGFGVAADHVAHLLEGRAVPPGRSLPLPVGQSSAADGEDDDHADGDAAFERAIAELARRADTLDGEWDRFVRSCLAQAPARAGDRGWFSMWDRGFAAIAMNPGCSDYYHDFRQAAEALRARVLDADEAGRRAGVYPGTRRTVRARYRLEWDER
jgi:S1-C subfamily serine protease